MPDTSAESNVEPNRRMRLKRVRDFSQKHWLGAGLSPENKATVDAIRREYAVTASEYYKAAQRLYENLTSDEHKGAPVQQAFFQINRNVQLFMAYSILWESFRVIAIAASCTHFAQGDAETASLEGERAQIERVLNPPYLEAADLAKITLLKNGETLAGAITRLSSHSSRELKDIYGITDTHTITDMEAFMQGEMEITEEQQPDGAWKPMSERDAWFVTALDDSGSPLDTDSPFSVEKYRSVIKWHCYQIRHNLNYVGKSEGSIDDAILIIRAFCLLEPIVGLLLQESRRKILFAL